MEFWHVAAAGLLVFAAVVGPFAVSGGGQQAAAVPMSDTKSTGVPESVVVQAADSTIALPTGQVSFSQFKFTVGYYGITSMVAGLQESTEREFGRPMAVYVSDFSGTGVYVGDDGLLRTPQDADPEWVPADAAYFVVNSTASIPTRKQAIVPFSNRNDATAFAQQYGGRIKQWDAVKQLDVRSAARTTAEWERTSDARSEQANETSARARSLLERPVSTTVEPNESLTAAIQRAPPNTTIQLSAGNHSVSDVTVDKPLTISGSGVNQTRIIGDENRSVVSVNASRVAITDVSLSGIGTVRTRGQANITSVPVRNGSFRERYWTTHGYGDAGIVFEASTRSLVADVQIQTRANGIIARNSPNLTVTNLTVRGTRDWEDGFLGVSILGAPALVQNSTFYGGKVGVFAHDTQSFTVRDSSMEGMMIGVFSVFAQGAFAADNDIEDTYVGVYIHDRSNRNIVTGNTVTNSKNGVLVFGRSSYVAENVVTHNQHGVVVQGQYSVYEENVAAFNRVGIRAMSLFPTNRVNDNDIAYNRRYAATARFNVLHVWKGNYWRGAPGIDTDGDGSLSRSFRVTGPVGMVAERGTGAPTLARSPALQLLRQLQQTMPGIRFGGVVDAAPRASPVRPAVLERLDDTQYPPGQFDDEDDWDFSF
ncbi:ABC-type transport system periplasmic substrate-binding protein (probable substrate copper) (plasmid) [Halobacterium hubeiense]|uniref:ABC-type transport system periplasmic substrate-binding protein (Probable substrate copper) n=1 Tax=Halobacterium hubeiense TaxID=1407499 RepID=A0A0U5H852_9EURY|nr:NosD domain-containing protein [Halobacterium hubeiense]CQH65106.1 ABC-type transport system periplasmic substrate-binding protein (probable substrate copper) [Halobacterium hubeiense]